MEVICGIFPSDLTSVEHLQLFGKAVEAFENALEVFTKADLPQDWARPQSNLGSALTVQGERATGEAAVALLGKAVEALRTRLRSTPRPICRGIGYW
jgi:hypothetical protein